MDRVRISNLVTQYANGSLTRRGFLARATALGMSAGAAIALANTAIANQATPAASPEASPVVEGEVIYSMTRDEYYAELESYYDLSEPETTGGRLIHTYTTDISTLNPIIASDVFSQMVNAWMYEGLVGNSLIDGAIVPSGLADSWEIAADGVTYTIHLNPNVTWHDGTPFTSDDVIFTFDVVVAEGSPSIRTSIVSEGLASYRAVDDHTVEFVSKQQSAMFLHNTANQFGIMPKHIWEDVPLDEMGSDAGSTGQDPSRVVGTGPFRFGEWSLGSRVVLERNAEYWDQDRVPNIDQYIFNIVEDTNTQIASLQAGETDLAGIASAQIDPLRASNPDLQYAEYDTGSMTYNLLNQDSERTELFTDVRVRQALHYALDRDVWVEAIQSGYATKAESGPQPPISLAYAPDQMNTVYDYDVDRARELLDEAGWTEGDDGIREKDGVRFSFPMIYNTDSEMLSEGMAFIQQYWREVGIEVEPEGMPFTVQLERLNNLDYDASLIQFVWGSHGFLGGMFYCDSLPPNGFNWMSYCNEEWDALDEQAQGELDEDRRINLLVDATNILNDECAVNVLSFSRAVTGAQPRVRNYFPNSYSAFWWLQYTWLDDA